MVEPEPEDNPNDAADKDEHEHHLFTFAAVLFELLLVPAAWLIAWVWKGDRIAPAPWNSEGAVLGVLLTLPLLACLAITVWTPLRKLKPLRRMYELVRDRFGVAIANLNPLQIGAIAIAAGIGEEVLFRGALQPRMGLVLTSILFGAVHWITPTYAIFAALMGLYLGWAYNASNDLLVPIVIHALYDAVAIYVIGREFRKEGLGMKSADEN